MKKEKESHEFTFFGLGTKWGIVTDDEILSEDVKKAVLDYVKNFEEHFSRFLPNSEVNAFRKAKSGDYIISKEFSVLLSKADYLRTLTLGVYDPAVGGLLERAGYDAKYTMKPSSNTEEFILPKWSLKNKTLTLDGPIAFDFGGIGKGYCIDQVADILKKFGYKYFLVDGGGDMFATIKKGDTPWKIAIEYPGKRGISAGVIYLKNQGLAVSDSFRRRWGKWHHLINPQLKKTIELVIGAVAVAECAWDADCMTSALFFSTTNKYTAIAEFYKSKYLVFQSDGTTKISANWEGELF